MAIAARLPVLVLAGMLLAACAIERSAPVDTSASRPFGESEFGESETAPTRDDVVAYARRYVTLRWVAGPEHLFHGVDADGVRLDTADARHVRRGGWEVGENIGMPYRWGGFDTPEEFARKVSLGWPAGHVEWSRDAPASKHAAGIDCSGLVSRSWGLTRKASTRDFPAISVALSDFASLLPGDILDKEDAHVLLFESFVDPARTHVRVIEAGAWDGSAWKVVESEYAVEALQEAGFVPLRDRRRTRLTARPWRPRSWRTG